MYAQTPIEEICPKCGGKILVYSSRPVPGGQLRYYGCKKCGFKPEPNQVTVPARFKTRH
jgi:DNA-directed RNA polymerase subunit RPC12/RpoP